MKNVIIFLILFLPCLIFSQNKKGSVNQYFSNQHLNLDSTHIPFLYYQVYNWIGAKYSYSGNDKKGIDCSGFAAEIYKNVYCIELSGGSQDIFKQVKLIDKKDLKEGDLLFFKIRRGKISHVAVYLNNNKFAHATTKIGVTINDLNEAYYKKYYYSCGRVENK